MGAVPGSGMGQWAGKKQQAESRQIVTSKKGNQDNRDMEKGGGGPGKKQAAQSVKKTLWQIGGIMTNEHLDIALGLESEAGERHTQVG